MDLHKRLQQVRSREAFIQFMKALVQDWKKRHSLIRRDDGADVRVREAPWKNYNCPDFLQAMQAWIADANEFPSDFPYQQIAEIMAAAANYDRSGKLAASHRGRPLNCWEFKRCGREPGGKNVAEFGICPATVWDRHEKVNRGECGGRVCWMLAGTFCGGRVQGIFAEKIETCALCEFYEYVRESEGKNFRHALHASQLT